MTTRITHKHTAQTEHKHDDIHHVCGNDSHRHCSDNEYTSVKERIEQAKRYCKQQGVRFTSLREQVYRLILQADKPMGAYDLLNEMQQQALKTNQTNSKKSKNIAPPTVYRSLEFLLEVGFIHQLTSINAFIPCCHPQETHLAGFLICKTCDRVQELSNNNIHQLVEQIKTTAGFELESSVIEMTGLCQRCQQ